MNYNSEDQTASLVQIALATNDDFHKIVETLGRIGVASWRDKKLFQSCHILHKRGNYYIVHFKELFILDGKQADITEEDLQRRNFITNLLLEWGLCTLVSGPEVIENVGSIFSRTKILKFHEKSEWTLESKHSLGTRQRHAPETL